MKHLEPLQKSVPSAEETLVVSSSTSKFTLFLVGMLLVAGIGYGMTSLWNSFSSDNVSDVKKSELIAEFSKLESIKVEPVAAQDTDTALDSMRLPPDQHHLLKTAVLSNNAHVSSGASTVQSDKTTLVWLSLWDFAAPDGDIVHISTAGYEMDVPLQKLENRIAIPVDATKTVKITGVRDGGGGITLGVKSGEVTVSMPVLGVGQILSLPLSY